MKKTCNPESLMMSTAKARALQEGAIKPRPMFFLTSTFVFKTAEEGKSFFEVAYGLREKKPIRGSSVWSNSPDPNNPISNYWRATLPLGINADDCADFRKVGMSAISTYFSSCWSLGRFAHLIAWPTYEVPVISCALILHQTGIQNNPPVRQLTPLEDVIAYGNASGLADHWNWIFTLEKLHPTDHDLFDINITTSGRGSFWQTRCTCFHLP